MCYRIILVLFFFSVSIFSQTTINWQYVGPKQTNEQVKGLFQSVWVDSSNTNFVLAGSACGGLFKCENAKDSLPIWDNISDTYDGMNFGVSDIVVKPNTNNKVIYISTSQIGGGMPLIYGNGILKTMDGGITWQSIGPKAEKENLFPFYGLKMNPENSDEMIAYSKFDLYITTDDWKTYKKIELPLEKEKELNICDVEFAPFENGKFYASSRTYNHFNAKLFQLKNFGNNIEDITPKNKEIERIEISTIYNQKYKGKFFIASGVSEIFINYFNGNFFSENLNKQGVYQTAGGAYWNLEFEVNQTDTNVIYVAMTEVSRSLDGGKTFIKIASYNGPNTHADVRGIHLSNSSNKGLKDKLFLANDGGISYLKDSEKIMWASLNGIGLNANMFWGIDVAQSDTLFVAGGTQDNGDFILKENTNHNNIYSCGDGYLAAVINEHSFVGECNAPSLIYWDLKTQHYNYLTVSDNKYQGRRPILFIDSTVYIGHHDIWQMKQHHLESHQSQFDTLTKIPYYYNENGSIKNNDIKSFAKNKNKLVLSYSNPNWGDKNNIGKLFYCEDISNKKPSWLDLSPIATYTNGLEICRWSEITSLQFDIKSLNTFYFISRDVFNQTNSHIYKMCYYIDSNKCSITEITYNLPKLGINKIIIDKYSNLMYAGVDDGVYYRDMINDTLNWHKLNTSANKLPNVMILDLVINYATNTLFTSAFGRGVYKTQLISNTKNEITISKNKTENQPIKIDGLLTIEKKKIYTINSKFILTKGSVIHLHKGSVLMIENKNLIRDENNKIISIDNFIKKHKTAKIISLK